MQDRHWTLDDIPWHKFDAAQVDPDLLKVAKAAALVEFNGDDYATYLCNVFRDDPLFSDAAKTWAHEEVQHGLVLARWAKLADPTFDFERAVERFRSGYNFPLDLNESIRGSRCGELVARCIVEVGTSSYYGSLFDAAKEPVLKEICRRIAADELRHYKLFYTHLKRYLDKDKVGRTRRLMVALGRMGETEGDELAYAYYAANAPDGESYDRKRYSRAYMVRAYGYYQEERIERAVAMIRKAAGLDPRSPWTLRLAHVAHRVMRYRRDRLVASGATAA